MIARALLAAWISSVVPHLVDGRGNHFIASQLSHEAADAFATACTESNPFDLDADGRLCGAFLVVMAGLESRFSLHPNGSNDHGHAAGPFQEWRGGDERSASWIRATRHYLGTIREAIVACPDQPIARLAGERCGSSSVHVERWAQIKTLVALPLEGSP